MNKKGDAVTGKNELIVQKDIQSLIHTVRGVQVMFDSDLAELYGTETKQLNRAVKRNREIFPEEFMFQLSENEYNSLKSQSFISNDGEDLRFQNGTSSDHGGRRYLPYVFTEQGVAMLSAVLRSETAVKMSIFRQFYLTFPSDEIRYTLRSELTWSHYRLILLTEEEGRQNYNGKRA